MLNKILKFADKFDMFPKSGMVLACVSGGVDSMCLLEALLDISRERGFSVGAAHFNHMLRGAESDRDEDFVRQRCAAAGVPFFCGAGDVRDHASANGLNIEAAAREMRYDFFYKTASGAGAERIATAHTADDNAETLILNLTRGAGAAGLSGIPPVRGTVVRPMLGVSREDVLRFAQRRGVSFVQDSTNELNVYTRNKIRHSVMPVLKDINPRFCEAAESAAELSRADEEYLSQMAEDFIEKHCRARRGPGASASLARASDANAGPEYAPDTQSLIPAPRAGPQAGTDELLKLPFAVSGRVIRKLHGGNLSYKHVRTVLEACKEKGPPVRISLPGADAYIEYGCIVFDKNPVSEGFSPVCIDEGKCVVIPEIRLKITCRAVKSDVSGHEADEAFEDEKEEINKSFTSFLFKSVDICGKMTVRSRREGDAIRFPGRNGTKTLKKLFIERRIPARSRALIPVIADEAGVLAVYGLGAGDRAVPQPGDEKLVIDFMEL